MENGTGFCSIGLRNLRSSYASQRNDIEQKTVSFSHSPQRIIVSKTASHVMWPLVPKYQTGMVFKKKVSIINL